LSAPRAPARVIGVRNFRTQTVDVVRCESGALPRADGVIVDVQDANTDLYHGTTGDVATLVRPGRTTRLPITGEARNIDGGERVQDDNVVVLYAPAASVAALIGERGYGWLSFRLRDTSPAAARSTITAVRLYLTGVPGFGDSPTCPSCAHRATGPARRTRSSSPTSSASSRCWRCCRRSR
jgi:hypothetical protein